MSSYHNQAIPYRPEIDGLRAIAVLPVILFHAGFELFSGGYVGVDIFFVISGYLITSIVLREMEQGKFSIARFYERRARRILPALLFVIACCLPFAWMWMLPDEFKRFGQSLVAVATFSSNIFFWKTTEYFAPAAEEQPLLHTWSLAVEEQYYVLFPLFLMLCWRFGKSKVVWLTALLAASSLLLSEWLWRHQPEANFYLLPTRAWELLAGSLIAFMPKVEVKNIKPMLRAQTLSLVGFLLILYSIFFFDQKTPFPSIYTVIPVSGTVLIVVFTARTTILYKVLTLKPLVGVGLISYSAYLWHQPIFAFIRLESIVNPTKALLAAGCVGSLLLAFITYKWIETPTRNRSDLGMIKGQQSNQRFTPILRYSIASLLMTLALGYGLHLRNSSPYLEPSLAKLIDKNRPKCKSSLESKFPDCVYGNIDGQPLLVLGDSHAENLLPALYSDELVSSKFKIIQGTYPGCIPAEDIVRLDKNASRKCSVLLHNVKGYIRNTPDLRILVMARWPLYLSGERFRGENGGHEQGPRVYLQSKDGKVKNGTNEFVNHVSLQFVNLVGVDAQVYWVSPVPEVGLNVPRVFAQGKSPDKFEPYMRDIEAREEASTKLVNQIQEKLSKPLVVIDPKEILCDDSVSKCDIIGEGPLYVDTNHLSFEGAQRLMPLVNQIIGSSQ